MKSMKVMKYVLISIFLYIGCGTVASVQPIGKGNSTVTLSSGGPVAPIFGVDMPIPYFVLRYRRGLSATMDVHASIHPTMMIMGNIALDAGVTKHFFDSQRWRPGLAVEGNLYAVTQLNDPSLINAFPELGVIGHYSFAQSRRILYFGMQSMYQYTEPYVVLAPLFGAELVFGRMMINLESKWYAPTEQSDNRVVDYTLIPANTGAIGFVWGISCRF
jgi:hypothetical protein